MINLIVLEKSFDPIGCIDLIFSDDELEECLSLIKELKDRMKKPSFEIDFIERV